MSASFSVRCLFQWLNDQGQSDTYLYEERITLWRADTVDAALALAEKEAARYARDNNLVFLNYSQAYALVEEVAVTNAEVFSLLRGSRLSAQAYLTQFFDTGTERQTSAFP